MAKDISDMFNLNITMYDDFETTKPDFNPMQGRKDTNMIVRLSKDGELINVDNPCGIIVKFFCYEEARPTVLKDIYTISPLNEDGTPNPDYNITVADNAITIPANIAMTDFAGLIKMTLIICCENTTGSVSIPFYYTYHVAPLAGYQSIGGNINVTTFAKVDLSNVSNTIFLAKAQDAGLVGSIYLSALKATDELITTVETVLKPNIVQVTNGLDYNSATGELIYLTGSYYTTNLTLFLVSTANVDIYLWAEKYNTTTLLWEAVQYSGYSRNVKINTEVEVNIKFLIYAAENDKYRIKAMSTSNTALSADARTLTNGVIMPAYKVSIHN